jgi:hypothetical protein
MNSAVSKFSFLTSKTPPCQYTIEGWMQEADRKFLQLEQQINGIEMRFCGTQRSYERSGDESEAKVDRADLKMIENRMINTIDHVSNN